MKCHLMQKPKHKLSAKDKRELQGKVNAFLSLSIAVGAKRALEILKESEVEADNENKENVL